jgi:hypothetical protein
MANPPLELWHVGADGRLYVRPHPAQARALRSEKRFVWMLAGTQGGKTSLGAVWLLREKQRCGPGDYLAVTATFPLLKLKMLPEFLRLWQDTLHLGEWRASDRVFACHDGSRVIFGSAINPDSLESATARAAWLDEVGQDDFRLGSWEAVLRRLSLSQGRVLGGTTLYNLGWLKQQVYDKWRGGAAEDHAIIQFESRENPAFPDEEYERARRDLPDWKFNLFYRGQYDRPAGLIYDAFDPRYREEGGHKVHAFDVPPAWPRTGGLDFGAVNTAKLALAHDPDADVYYLYREDLSGGKTTAEHAAEAKAWMAGVNWQTWHGGSKSETQQRMDWGREGVTVLEPPVSDVEAGLDRVIALCKASRLYVFDTCLGTLDELGTYAREVDEQGQPTEKIKDKQTYHRLDALRYAVLKGHQWDWGGAD